MPPGFDELRVLKLEMSKDSNETVSLPQLKFLGIFIVLSGHAKVSIQKNQGILDYSATKFSTWYISPESAVNV